MDLQNYKDMEREGFLFEVQQIALEIESLIDKYDVREDVMSLMIIGLIDEMEDTHQLKAVYGYNLRDRSELEELVTFAQDSFKGNDEPDIDDLIKGLGISLN
jgi:hypothetical protein|tara:strand:- start:27569 stop:27874 length:306 start_codon:yes stop_codon:yes gene_type:complete